MANLQRALTMSGGTATFGDAYAARSARSRSGPGTPRRATPTGWQWLPRSMSSVRLSAVCPSKAANLMQTQKAYEAAACVLNAVDEMLDRLINGTGLVGQRRTAMRITTPDDLPARDRQHAVVGEQG